MAAQRAAQPHERPSADPWPPSPAASHRGPSPRWAAHPPGYPAQRLGVEKSHAGMVPPHAAVLDQQLRLGSESEQWHTWY
jgi:hypothetical protein